jgi:hypothetical protein
MIPQEMGTSARSVQVGHPQADLSTESAEAMNSADSSAMRTGVATREERFAKAHNWVLKQHAETFEKLAR